MNLDPSDLNYICKLVKDRSAIALDPTKGYLIIARLEPLARAEGFGSLEQLFKALRGAHENGLHYRVVEAMTTNETSFFRDLHPFEALRKHVLPQLIAARQAQRQLTIWCAACSSGQEPYTLCMVLKEHFPILSNWNVRIIATDYSKEMVQRARKAVYSQLEVNRGLPATYLVKYFTRVGMDWQVAESLRQMVSFEEINLAAQWPALPSLDLVLIRNVMIYFDIPTKIAILKKIRGLLRPDGYLMLGGAETTINLDDAFERVSVENTSVYRIKP